MITAYQQLERGNYVINSSALSLVNSISAHWNPSPPDPTDQPAEGDGYREQENNSDSTSELPPPRLCEASASETNISPPASVSSLDRLSSAGDGLRSVSGCSTEPEGPSGGFLKSPIEWVKKKFSFKRYKSSSCSSSTSAPSLHAHDVRGGTGPSASRSTSGLFCLFPPSPLLTHRELSMTELPLLPPPNEEKQIQWQLFHLGEQEGVVGRQDCGYPEPLTASSVPWLIQVIRTYQDHHPPLSTEERISALTTSLPPLILSTPLPSTLAATERSAQQVLHLLDVSNVLFRSLSSRNSTVFLVWNESAEIFSAPSTAPTPSSPPQEEPLSSKDDILAVFQSPASAELRLLFLEFLELNLQLQKNHS
jgi:hypothetical protein